MIISAFSQSISLKKYSIIKKENQLFFMKKIILIFSLLFFIPSVKAATIDSLLYELDLSIQERPASFEQKENTIKQLKEDLSKSSSDEDRYTLLRTITNEYSFYKIDSAVYYSDQCISMATKLNKEDNITELQLDRIYYYSFLRLFHESFEKMEAMDYEALPVFLKKKYLKTMILTYYNKVRGLESAYSRGFYNSEIMKYCAMYLAIEPNETIDRLRIKAYTYYLQEDYEASGTFIKQILDKKDLSIYERVEMLNHLNELYNELGKEYNNEAKKVLIEAAILSNQYAITKNPPLLELALLISEDDYNRAHDYIDIAMKDASVFSIDHKIGVREKTYNEIQDIYYNKINEQRIVFQVVLVIICILSIITLFFLVITIKSNNTLRKTREKLVNANDNLKESNRIKEVYFSYYLNQYSNYIDKITEYQRHIVRLINAGHSTDVIKKEALSSMNTKSDLNDFYSDFDKSVLELFPSFIQKVNELLRPDEAYKIRSNPKDTNSRLNTELRILALLRLGICDNKEIASFFRFTVQTVYNYRSKAKMRAIDDASFEENIKNICNDGL